MLGLILELGRPLSFFGVFEADSIRLEGTLSLISVSIYSLFSDVIVGRDNCEILEGEDSVPVKQAGGTRHRTGQIRTDSK